MKRPIELQREEETMGTLLVLTSAFEGIASFHLAKIRAEVLKAGEFFDSLWQIYSKIRVDKAFHFGRSQEEEAVINKELYIIITAEGGFSGDVDQRIIRKMRETLDPAKQDIIVIGQHGVTLLDQMNIKLVKFYKLPGKDLNINVGPLVSDVQKYNSTTVFFSRYITLTNQSIQSIKLSALVQELGGDVKVDDEVISDINYIFEPSNYAVIDHLEKSMLFITLSQLILGSKLAQYASRFRSMTLAREQAEDSKAYAHLQYRRAVRSLADERSKETMNSLRKIRSKV
jgi:F0F1-type ATP synthase gamma subunit